MTEFLDYDEFDRPGRIKAPDNAEVSFAYQGVRVVDRTVEIAKSAGATDVTTRETYDRQGRLYQVQEPQGTGAAFTYTYDEGGRLAQVHTDPSGANNEQTRSFAYDGRGFLLSESHPEKIAAVTYSGYDARGQVGRKVDGPNILDFTYDRAERLTRIDGWDGAVKEYRYDDSSPSTSLRLNGRLREAVRHNWVDLAGDDADLFIDVAVTETYAYEGVGGRVSSRTTVTSENDLQFHQTFVYDGIGQVTEIGYPVCLGSIDCPANDVTRTIENVYANGWLTAVGETGDMGKYAQSITYHPNGLWSAITRPSGVQDIQDVASHGMRRPERIQVTGVAGGTAFDTGLYTYDGAGNIAAMGLDSFEYDSSSRLSAAEVHGYAQSFTYDWYGNLTSYITDGDVTSIPTDPMTNRIANPALATYDAAGNMTSLSGHTYEYDELNQLVSRDPDLGANQDSLWSAIYTADDERLAVWEVEAEDSGWEARWTLRGLDGKVLRQYAFSRSGAGESIFEDGFESGDLCAWTDDSGSGPTCRSHGWFWERDHVYRDGQLLAEVGELNVLHRHVDHLGSLRQVTDEQGIWQEDHAYLPFGEEVPASSRVPLQFTGHERDSHGAGSADDLDYMHARYCSPTMGRFLSVDPVSSSSPRKPQSWNKYAYALDNPIKFLDPDGRTVVGFYGSGGSTIGGVGAALDALIPHTAAVGGVRGFYGGFYPPSGVEEAVSFITSDRRRAPETSLVLFGHSRGAVSALKTARLLAQGGDSAAVDLLVTADPALNLPGSRVVPPNVRTAINFFQLSLGVNLRGDTLRAADPSRTNVFNIQLDATHTGIDEAVAQAIVSFVLDLAASGQLGHLEEGLQFLQGQLINVMAE